MKYNRILSILCILIMCMFSTSMAFADNDQDDLRVNSNEDLTLAGYDYEFLPLIGTTSVRTVSEYDMIKELKEQPDSQLRKAGYSSEEINTIRKQPLKAKIISDVSQSEEKKNAVANN